MKVKRPSNYLIIPGFHTPRLFVFLHGFFNGRFHTAEVDRETGKVTSAYLVGKQDLFDRMTKNYVVHLEEDLHERRVRAEKLILEYQELQEQMAALDGVPEGPDLSVRPVTQAEAREQRRASKEAGRVRAEKARINERCFQIRIALGELRADLRSAERVFEETIRSTAHTLQEKFAIYVHGVLLTAVYMKHVPEIVFEHFLEGYLRDHTALIHAQGGVE